MLVGYPAVCVKIGFILTNTSNKGEFSPAVACRLSTEERNPGAAGKSPTCICRFRIVRVSGTAGNILMFTIEFSHKEKRKKNEKNI